MTRLVISLLLVGTVRCKPAVAVHSPTLRKGIVTAHDKNRINVALIGCDLIHALKVTIAQYDGLVHQAKRILAGPPYPVDRVDRGVA